MKKTLLIALIMTAAAILLAQDHIHGAGKHCHDFERMEHPRIKKAGRGFHGEGMMMIMDEIELSEEQRDEIETMRVKLHKEKISLKAEIEMKEVDFKVAAKDFDFSTMKKLTNEILEIEKKLKGKHIDNMESCWNVLTEEQQKEVKELLKERPRRLWKEKMEGEGNSESGLRRNRKEHSKWIEKADK